MRRLLFVSIVLLAAPVMAQVPTSRPASEAVDRLASLRRSVENVPDIKQIVDRYQTFVKQYAGTPVEEDAKKDLATWQERLDKKMIKVGGKWITPEERAALSEQSLEAADNIRQLLKQGRLKEADATLKTALDLDPRNPSALYLSGVLAYRQDQLLPARKAFEAVNALVPNHAPTLNNLAVILFRSKQFPGSMAFYDQAMNASPNNKEILNNVAEALDALPESEQNGVATKKVMRRFTEQDTKVGKEMNAQNMYRWGATWVTKEQMTELQAHEREIKDRLDQLAAEFDSQKITIADIEKNLKEANRQIGNLDNTGYVRASDGKVYKSVPTVRYGEVKSAASQLDQERAAAYEKLEAIRTAARELKKSYSIPQYSGVQHIIEGDGTPSILPAPATQPTSAPTRAPTPFGRDDKKK